MNKSNIEIVEDVYRTFKIKELIKQMIDYSYKDQSCDDLHHYIMIKLLEMDNKALNELYKPIQGNPNKVVGNKLRNFISQIILRQRNGGKNKTGSGWTHYQKELRMRGAEGDQFIILSDTEYNYEEDSAIELIINYIAKKADMDENIKYSSQELRSILAFNILKKYYTSELTLLKISKHLNISLSSVNKLIRFAKNDIVNYYEKIIPNICIYTQKK